MPDAPPDPTLVTVLLALIGGFFAFAAGAAWLNRLRGGRPLFEPEPRRDVPWGNVQMALALAIAFGTLVVAVAIYALVRRGGATPESGRSLDTLLVNGLWMVAALFAIAAFLRATSGATLADFGIRRRGLGREILRGVVACSLALPVVYFIQAVCILQWKPTRHFVEKAISEGPAGPTVLVGAVMAVLLAPAWEEFFFRGVLLGGLLKIAWPLEAEEELGPPPPAAVWGPNALVSVFFAGLHMEQWPAPIPLFFLSLGLGELYRRSRSIVGPFIMHACFNGLGAAAALMTSRAGAGGP